MSETISPRKALEDSDEALERLERRLRIDKFALDDELIEQPAYLAEIGKKHVESISYRDEAKNNLDGTRAKVDQELRNQIAVGGEKVTETGIASRVLINPEYQNALFWFGAWSDRVNSWRVVWDSACARTDMLKGLSHLYASGYWADRGISQERRGAMATKADAIKEDIQNQRRERRKL